MSTQTTRLVSRAFVGLAVLTIVLGMIGYARAPLEVGDGLNTDPGFWRFFDYLYMSMQLLALSGRDVKGEPVLLLARWLGALFAFGVIVRVLVPPIGEWLVRLRIRFMSGHTVVIGLSDKGRALVLDASDQDKKQYVVALDVRPIDEETFRDSTLDAREWRAIRKRLYLLRGDAARPEWLSRLNIKRAARVYVVTQSDALNVELARKIVLEFAAHRSEVDPLPLRVHVGQTSITDDLLSGLEAPPSVTIRAFSLPSMAARMLLAHWPLAIAAREQGAARMNLVFVGFDAFSAALLLHVLRLGPLGGQGRPRITIFTDALSVVRLHLHDHELALKGMAESLAVRERDASIDLSDADLTDVEERDGYAPVTAIIVVAPSDAESYLLARRVRRVTARAGRWQAPLFVRLQQTEQFGESLPTLERCKVLADVIEPFGELRRACSEAALRDWHERIAVALHAGYLADERTAAQPDRTSPAERAWNALSEEFREANRRAVDHFPLKLATAGWIVRGEMPLLAKPLDLDDLAVEELARLEHASWMSEKLLAGWRPSAERDDRRRFHDYLIDYDLLGIAQKKDISQLRRVEALLQPPMDSRVSIDLARWREAVGATVFRERTIGLVGHSAISVDQTRQIAAMIPRLVESLRAEERLGPSGDEFWTLVTPLAPGVDFVLPRLLCRALGAMPELNQPRRRRYRLLVVRGLSPRRLAQAYLARVTDQSDATPDGVRTVVHQDFTGRRPLDSIAAIEKLLGDFARLEQVCERVIDLSPAHDPADRDAMHAGLSAANRYLLERCDDLVAVIDPARYGEKRPLDVDRWRGVDSNALPAHGTGALVSAWLRRPSRRHAAVGPLSPSGLHPIEIQ